MIRGSLSPSLTWGDWRARIRARARTGAVAIALPLLAVAVLLPIVFAFNASFKTAAGYLQNLVSPAWPPSFDAYQTVAQDIDVWTGLIVSIAVSAGTVIVVWITGSMAAYSLVKIRFVGAHAVLLAILATLLIPVQVILEPFFLTVRDVGLLNTHLGLVLSFAAFQLPLIIFLFAAYFKGIPTEIIESARLEGASAIQILRLIVMPISRPVFATTGIISFVGAFNDVLLPIMVLSDARGQTLLVRLTGIHGSAVFNSDPSVEAAGSIIGILPMLLLFLVAQRQLIRGATAGAMR